MRANISEELINAIDDKIYIDLQIHVLNKKLIKAEQEGNVGFAKHISNVITEVTQQRKQVNDYLRQNNVKVFDAEEVDDMFVEYKFYQKVEGGYKEGNQRYWKAALKYSLKRRMKKYFAGGD